MVAAPVFVAWWRAIHTAYVWDAAGLNALVEQWADDFGAALDVRMQKSQVYDAATLKRITDEVAAEHTPRLTKLHTDARVKYEKTIGDAWSSFPAGALRSAARDTVAAYVEALNDALRAQDGDARLSTWYSEYAALQRVLIEAAADNDLSSGSEFPSKTTRTKRFVRDLGRLSEVEERRVTESAGSTTETRSVERYLYRGDVLTGVEGEEVISRTVRLDVDDDEGEPWDGPRRSTVDEVLDIAISGLYVALVAQVNAQYAIAAPAASTTSPVPQPVTRNEKAMRTMKRAAKKLEKSEGEYREQRELVTPTGRWRRTWERSEPTWPRQWQGGL